jgi:hypothetical protein
VPLDPLPPPLLEIVTLPLAPLIEIPVPAMILTTPVLVTSIVFVFALVFTEIPVLPVKVLYGLAHANRVLKFVTVLLNAAYNESLPEDSLGNPICITCFPEIDII